MRQSTEQNEVLLRDLYPKSFHIKGCLKVAFMLEQKEKKK